MDSKIYFKDVASQWDNMRKSFFSEDIREKAYEIANVKEGKLAADIGAGTGFVTEGLLEKGLRVIAVDQSEEMLNQMKEKFMHSNAIDFRQGDAEKLPVEDNSIDYVIANMYLHHVENPLNAIKEMVRILKPGGKLVITDLDEHTHEFLRTEQYDRWMGFKRLDIENWFLEAGLNKVTVDCAGGNCCTASNCGEDNASISIFIAGGEK